MFPPILNRQNADMQGNTKSCINDVCVCVCVCFGMCVHVCIQMVHLIEEAASWRDGELKRNGERKGRWILLARGKGDAIKMETQGRTANR